jgi:hypothetical protein
MSNQMAQEAVELLVASAYCPGHISQPPGATSPRLESIDHAV